MKTTNVIIGLVLIAIMASCSGTKIYTDMDKSADFTAYKTYQLKTANNEEGYQAFMNELNEKRMIKAIENNLELNGMEKSENPDAYIVYGFDMNIRKGYYSSTNYGGGWYWGGSSISTMTETNTTNGTLSIAIIDSKTDELLWIGAGTQELKFKSNKFEENINAAVSKIFEKFPIEHESMEENPELISHANNK